MRGMHGWGCAERVAWEESSLATATCIYTRTYSYIARQSSRPHKVRLCGLSGWSYGAAVAVCSRLNNGRRGPPPPARHKGGRGMKHSLLIKWRPGQFHLLRRESTEIKRVRIFSEIFKIKYSSKMLCCSAHTTSNTCVCLLPLFCIKFLGACTFNPTSQ